MLMQILFAFRLLSRTQGGILFLHPSESNYEIKFKKKITQAIRPI